VDDFNPYLVRAIDTYGAEHLNPMPFWSLAQATDAANRILKEAPGVVRIDILDYLTTALVTSVPRVAEVSA